MVCPRCAKENDDDARFCAKCGRNLEDARKEALLKQTPDDEIRYCYRHPKEATNLSCGRCEKPICTRCAILGPAGPRCPDCAKSDVVFRPAAVGLGVKRTFRSVGTRGPWAWYYVVILGMLLFGGLRACTGFFSGPQLPPMYEEEYVPPPIEEGSRDGE